MATHNPSILKKTLRLLHQLEDGFLVFLLLIMLVLAASQVIMREVFNSGAAWIDPLLRNAVLWLGLFGALLAARYNKHIEIDLLTRLLSGRLKITLNLLIHLFAAAVCGIIAYHAGRFVFYEIEDGTTAFANLPAWPFEIVIPFVFGLLSLRYLGFLIARIRQLFSETPC